MLYDETGEKEKTRKTAITILDKKPKVEYKPVEEIFEEMNRLPEKYKKVISADIHCTKIQYKLIKSHGKD